MADTDVIIVGAGLSGLSAAYELKTHGVNFVVLEASDRVGGRLHTIHNDDVGYVDVGGAYIGPTQNRVFRLAKQLGVGTYEVYDEGDLLYFSKGQSHRFQSNLPPMGSLPGLLDLNNLYRLLDAYSERIPADEPWNAPEASKWDTTTLQEWYNKIIWTDATMREAKLLSRLNMTSEANTLSLLSTLWYIKQAGGTARMNATEGGAQERKFIGGSQQLCSKIAENLEGNIHLNSPVVDLKQNSAGIVVKTVNGRVFKGSQVILAMAPSLQQRIVFDPPLPSARTQLIQRHPMGSVIKTMTYYDQPYWRKNGLVGTMFTVDEDPELPVGATMDDCKPDGSKPAIMGFILADKAVYYSRLTKEQRRDLVSKQYAKVFQCPEMAKPVYYEEKDWSSETWSAGGYTGTMGPGVLTTYGSSLRAPIGRIHLAGTETATEWTGYMEGAIQAGERAAREILCKLDIISEADVNKPEPKNKDHPAPDLSPGFWSRHAPSVPGLIKSLGGVGVFTAGAAAVKLLKPKL